VPAIIAYEPFDSVLDRSLILTTAIPGASLDDDPLPDPSPILTAAGADLARINQVPVDGFGWIRRDDSLPTRLRGTLPTWPEFAADLTTHPLDPWFDPPTIARITELARIPPANPDQAHLAHGDFDSSHLFSQHGRYTGIIDFGEIRGTEPTFDLGHLAIHSPDSLPAIIEGYASLSPLPDDLWRQIGASALRIGWFRLTQSSARTNPPYADHLRSSMLRLASDVAQHDERTY
jgi:aminoglycoside phosphotransferase (APT) family kinase protein